METSIHHAVGLPLPGIQPVLGSGAAAGAQRWAMGDLQLAMVMFVAIGCLLDCKVLASARCNSMLATRSAELSETSACIYRSWSCCNRPNKVSIKMVSMLQRPAHQVWNST